MSIVDVSFQDRTLLDIAHAFIARRKALKHKSDQFLISRNFADGTSNHASEQLILALAVQLATEGRMEQPRFQIRVWSDRWVSGTAYQRSTNGDSWTAAFGGRMAASLKPKQFQHEIESFWDGLSVGKYRTTREAETYWENKLVHGPVGVVQKRR